MITLNALKAATQSAVPTLHHMTQPAASSAFLPPAFSNARFSEENDTCGDVVLFHNPLSLLQVDDDEDIRNHFHDDENEREMAGGNLNGSFTRDDDDGIISALQGVRSTTPRSRLDNASNDSPRGVNTSGFGTLRKNAAATATSAPPLPTFVAAKAWEKATLQHIRADEVFLVHQHGTLGSHRYVCYICTHKFTLNWCKWDDYMQYLQQKLSKEHQEHAEIPYGGCERCRGSHQHLMRALQSAVSSGLLMSDDKMDQTWKKDFDGKNVDGNVVSGKKGFFSKKEKERSGNSISKNNSGTNPSLPTLFTAPSYSDNEDTASNIPASISPASVSSITASASGRAHTPITTPTSASGNNGQTLSSISRPNSPQGFFPRNSVFPAVPPTAVPAAAAPTIIMPGSAPSITLTGSSLASRPPLSPSSMNRFFPNNPAAPVVTMSNTAASRPSPAVPVEPRRSTAPVAVATEPCRSLFSHLSTNADSSAGESPHSSSGAGAAVTQSPTARVSHSCSGYRPRQGESNYVSADANSSSMNISSAMSTADSSDRDARLSLVDSVHNIVASSLPSAAASLLSQGDGSSATSAGNHENHAFAPHAHRRATIVGGRVSIICVDNNQPSSAVSSSSNTASNGYMQKRASICYGEGIPSLQRSDSGKNSSFYSSSLDRDAASMPNTNTNNSRYSADSSQISSTTAISPTSGTLDTLLGPIALRDITYSEALTTIPFLSDCSCMRSRGCFLCATCPHPFRSVHVSNLWTLTPVNAIASRAHKGAGRHCSGLQIQLRGSNSPLLWQFGDGKLRDAFVSTLAYAVLSCNYINRLHTLCTNGEFDDDVMLCHSDTGFPLINPLPSSSPQISPTSSRLPMSRANSTIKPDNEAAGNTETATLNAESALISSLIFTLRSDSPLRRSLLFAGIRAPFSLHHTYIAQFTLGRTPWARLPLPALHQYRHRRYCPCQGTCTGEEACICNPTHDLCVPCCTTYIEKRIVAAPHNLFTLLGASDMRRKAHIDVLGAPVPVFSPPRVSIFATTFNTGSMPLDRTVIETWLGGTVPAALDAYARVHDADADAKMEAMVLDQAQAKLASPSDPTSLATAGVSSPIAPSSPASTTASSYAASSSASVPAAATAGAGAGTTASTSSPPLLSSAATGALGSDIIIVGLQECSAPQLWAQEIVSVLNDRGVQERWRRWKTAMEAQVESACEAREAARGGEQQQGVFDNVSGNGEEQTKADVNQVSPALARIASGLKLKIDNRAHDVSQHDTNTVLACYPTGELPIPYEELEAVQSPVAPLTPPNAVRSIKDAQRSGKEVAQPQEWPVWPLHVDPKNPENNLYIDASATREDSFKTALLLASNDKVRDVTNPEDDLSAPIDMFLSDNDAQAPLFYDLVIQQKLWGIGVVVLVRRDLLPLITDVHAVTVATGMGGLLGNKGGVGVYLRVASSPLLVVCSHLAAREERAAQRNFDFQRILRGISAKLTPKLQALVDVNKSGPGVAGKCIQLCARHASSAKIDDGNTTLLTANPSSSPSTASSTLLNSVTSNFNDHLSNHGSRPDPASFIDCPDCTQVQSCTATCTSTLRLFDPLVHTDLCLWLGDLNYRVITSFETATSLCKQHNFASLLLADQLKHEMHAQRVFAGFTEPPIHFPPSYRWERKAHVFSNKRAQPPSWTDRVLAHTDSPHRVVWVSYGMRHSALGSDHRPVVATLLLEPRSLESGGAAPLPQLVRHYTNNVADAVLNGCKPSTCGHSSTSAPHTNAKATANVETASIMTNLDQNLDQTSENLEVAESHLHDDADADNDGMYHICDCAGPRSGYVLPCGCISVCMCPAAKVEIRTPPPSHQVVLHSTWTQPTFDIWLEKTLFVPICAEELPSGKRKRGKGAADVAREWLVDDEMLDEGDDNVEDDDKEEEKEPPVLDQQQEKYQEREEDGFIMWEEEDPEDASRRGFQDSILPMPGPNPSNTGRFSIFNSVKNLIKNNKATVAAALQRSHSSLITYTKNPLYGCQNATSQKNNSDTISGINHAENAPSQPSVSPALAVDKHSIKSTLLSCGVSPQTVDTFMATQTLFSLPPHTQASINTTSSLSTFHSPSLTLPSLFAASPPPPLSFVFSHDHTIGLVVSASVPAQKHATRLISTQHTTAASDKSTAASRANVVHDSVFNPNFNSLRDTAKLANTSEDTATAPQQGNPSPGTSQGVQTIAAHPMFRAGRQSMAMRSSAIFNAFTQASNPASSIINSGDIFAGLSGVPESHHGDSLLSYDLMSYTRMSTHLSDMWSLLDSSVTVTLATKSSSALKAYSLPGINNVSAVGWARIPLSKVASAFIKGDVAPVELLVPVYNRGIVIGVLVVKVKITRGTGYPIK